MIRKFTSISLMMLMVSMLLPSFGFSAEPVTIAIVCELSGPGAGPRVGTRWEKGARLAIEEINAAGGLLGRKIEAFTLDTKNDPAFSMAAMKKAMERKPFVVLGTVMSTSTIVNMTILQEAGIPQITGSEGTAITQKGNPNIFRTSYNPSRNMQKLVKFILESFKAKKLGVIYVNNVLGVSGRDAVMEQLKGKLEIVADIATEEGQADFTGELSRLKASGADTLYLHTHEEEGGKVMVQLKNMGLKVNVCSVGLDLSHVSRLAKESGDGLVGFDEPYGAPDSPVGKKYSAKYGEDIDSEAVKGYIAPHVVRAVVNKTKSFDQQKFRDTLHKLTICVKDEPGVLWDLHYDEHGDIDRESVMITIEKGKLKVLETMPPLYPGNFGVCKK